MITEAKKALDKLKDDLPKKGAYPMIVKKSNGTLTIDIVKSTFSGRTKDLDTIAKVSKYAKAVITALEKEREKQIKAIKRFASG